MPDLRPGSTVPPLGRNDCGVFRFVRRGREGGLKLTHIAGRAIADGIGPAAANADVDKVH